MDIIYIVSAKDKQVENLANLLQTQQFSVEVYDTIFEFNRSCSKMKPDYVFAADNFKEKDIAGLMSGIRKNETILNVPVFGINTNPEKNTIAQFLTHGAVDGIHPPFDIVEVQARMKLRMQEVNSRKQLTSAQFFFNEAQEKEQGKRTGIFTFYDTAGTRVGEISVQQGRIVHATYAGLIKEDAFLQIACNESLRFHFQDTNDIDSGSFNEGITNLLLEASKLKDEIKKQQNPNRDEIKALIIDNNRIARIMTSRVLKELNIENKVTGPDELSVRFMASFAPQFLVIDYSSAEKVLDKLWPSFRTEKDIPVIIYCDEDVKNLNSGSIKKHLITATVYKEQIQKKIREILQQANILP